MQLNLHLLDGSQWSGHIYQRVMNVSDIMAWIEEHPEARPLLNGFLMMHRKNDLEEASMF